MMYRVHVLLINDHLDASKLRTRFQSVYGTFSILLALILSGCTTQRQIDAAKEKGARSGRSDGWSAGEGRGYREAVDLHEREVFRKTLWDMYWEGNFQRPRLWRWVTTALGVLMGFTLQWAVFWGMRRFGQLIDVDSILKRKGSKAASGLLLAVGLLSSQGCENPVQKAWKSAYDNAYKTAFDEGMSHGSFNGGIEGLNRGLQKARDVTRTGKSWWLYIDLLAWGALLGCFIGIALQYSTLLVIRWTGRVNEFWSPLLVPGIASSASYGFVIGRQAELLRYSELLKELDERMQESMAKMAARANRVRDGVCVGGGDVLGLRL